MALKPEQVEQLNGRQLEMLANLGKLAQRERPIGYGPEQASPCDTRLQQLADMGLAVYNYRLEGYMITQAGLHYLRFRGGDLWHD